MEPNSPEASGETETAAEAELMTISLPLDQAQVREQVRRFEEHLTLASAAAASQGAHLDIKIILTSQATAEPLQDIRQQTDIPTLRNTEPLSTANNQTGSTDLNMDVDEAYRLLGIILRTVDDTAVFVSYAVAVHNHPGNSEQLLRALKAIADSRQSDRLQQFDLDLQQRTYATFHAPILPPTNDRDPPLDTTVPIDETDLPTEASEETSDEEAPRVVSQCKICMDDLTANDTIVTINCGCTYCVTCLNAHIKHALTSRTSYPARCCGHDGIDIGDVAHHLTMDVIERWSEVEMEFNERLPMYCANKECSAHIPEGRLGGENKFIDCNSCMTDTCKECKQGRAVHTGESSDICPEDIVSKEDRELVDAENWKQCPGCRNLIERTDGCNNMACECGTEFCYDCGEEFTDDHRCGCETTPDADGYHHRRGELPDDLDDLDDEGDVHPHEIMTQDRYIELLGAALLRGDLHEHGAFANVVDATHWLYDDEEDLVWDDDLTEAEQTRMFETYQRLRNEHDRLVGDGWGADDAEAEERRLGGATDWSNASNAASTEISQEAMEQDDETFSSNGIDIGPLPVESRVAPVEDIAAPDEGIVAAQAGRALPGARIFPIIGRPRWHW